MGWFSKGGGVEGTSAHGSLCYTELELKGKMVKGGEEIESREKKRGHLR